MRHYLLLLLAFCCFQTFSCQNQKVADSSIGWSSKVWEEALPIYNKIIQHPFILELADGSLSLERFSRYLAQDIIYCDNFYKQLARFDKLITNDDEKKFFAPYTDLSGGSESDMQQTLLAKYGVNPASPSSVTLAYTKHEQESVDSCSKEIAIAGLLPCLWVYNKVGLHILSITQLEDNPYKEWILEYSDEEYSEWIDDLLILIDSWAKSTDEDTRAKMTKAFLESAQFEYDFWDYGYNGDL